MGAKNSRCVEVVVRRLPNADGFFMFQIEDDIGVLR